MQVFIPEIDPDVCFECKALKYEDHHVVPESLGGTRTVPLCKECHDTIHERGISFKGLARQSRKKLAKLGFRSEGAIPFGRDIKGTKGKKVLIPNQEELEILADILHMRMRNCTFIEIAAHLNLEGKFSKNGKRWIGPLVRQLMFSSNQNKEGKEIVNEARTILQKRLRGEYNETG